MRCFLLNAKEQIVHAFDAADLTEARTEMRTRCLVDGGSYALAVVVRRGILNVPPTTPVVDDQPA
jgi:hypothetical protein